MSFDPRFPRNVYPPHGMSEVGHKLRVPPAAAPAMSVMPRKRRSATKMRSVAMGHKQTQAPQQALDYWITSSAVASSDVGTAMPSVLAVLRLIDNTILVGNSTGSSPGGVPCRILSTK
jgi:hypothetical protein